MFSLFNATATTEFYTLSLHDALPISGDGRLPNYRPQFRAGQPPGLPNRYRWTETPSCWAVDAEATGGRGASLSGLDRKSTRLNSSHQIISYAVFCLKKKKTTRGSRRH